MAKLDKSGSTSANPFKSQKWGEVTADLINERSVIQMRRPSMTFTMMPKTTF